MKLYAKLLFLFGLSFLLSSCLVPDNYYASLSLSNQAYSYDYVGDIHMAATHSQEYIDRAKGNKEKLAETIAKEFSRLILERDKSTVKLVMLSTGVFKTKFLYVSPYIHPEVTGMFNFSIDGDTLTVTSRELSNEDKIFLKQFNITSKGLLCIKTVGKILESNADRAGTPKNRCNEWDMENLDRQVKIVVKFPKKIILGAKKAQ